MLPPLFPSNGKTKGPIDPFPLLFSFHLFSNPFFLYRERGVVINQNEATVGEVLGDGLVLSFSDPSMVGEFDVCLRLNTEESGKYNILDFGYSISSLEAIQPLGLSFSFLFFFSSILKSPFFFQGYQVSISETSLQEFGIVHLLIFKHLKQ